MIVAHDALNRLVAYLCDSGTDSNMNRLLGFTVLAFHRRDHIALVSHRWFLYAGGFYRIHFADAPSWQIPWGAPFGDAWRKRLQLCFSTLRGFAKYSPELRTYNLPRCHLSGPPPT